MTTKWHAIVFGVTWILVGIVIWGVGVFGIAVGLEDRCLQVAVNHDYGASSQSASIWPPNFTCQLKGPEYASAADQLNVEQLGAALLRTGWTLGFPVAWIVFGAVVRLRWPRGRALPQRQR